MIRLKYIPFAALMLCASACSDEAAYPVVDKSNEGRAITFGVSLPDVAVARAQVVSKDDLESFQVTCFYPDSTVAAPYFENQTYKLNETEGSANLNFSPVVNRNCLWPEFEKTGTLQFYAFSPSLDTMRTICGNDYYFKLRNETPSADSKTVIYSIDNFRVANNISKQVDFIAARASAEIPDVSTDTKDVRPITLSFGHMLSNIEIKATNRNNDTAFEIAGVRIGNPVVAGKFVYSPATDAIGSWDLTSKVNNPVEYVFGAGETLVSLDENEKSIMGKAGNAMVIPAEIEKWELPADPASVTLRYSTDQMYFSVLLRVTKSNKSKTRVYPYTDDSKYPEMKVIYFAVDGNNKIIRQVDKDDQPKDGETIKEFGWASVPVSVKWLASNRYLYTLDYSAGIGYHDPEDPEPGTPIGEDSPGLIGVKVKVIPWEDASGLYNPDIYVPYE